MTEIRYHLLLSYFNKNGSCGGLTFSDDDWLTARLESNRILHDSFTERVTIELSRYPLDENGHPVLPANDRVLIWEKFQT